jgi:hypothetical protein
MPRQTHRRPPGPPNSGGGSKRFGILGYDIQVEIIHAGGPRESPIFGVRSDMIGGLPPATGGANGHG